MVTHPLNKPNKIAKVYDHEFKLKLSWVIFSSKEEASNGLDEATGSKKECLLHLLAQRRNQLSPQIRREPRSQEYVLKSK